MPQVYSPVPHGATTGSGPPRKLLDQVRDVVRVKRYSYRTEQAHVDWIRRFILFHEKRYPAEMGREEVERYLTWLAMDQVAPNAERRRRCLARFRFHGIGCEGMYGFQTESTIDWSVV